MSKYFSPSKLGFYDASLKSAYVAAGSWPDDLVEITDEIWGDFLSTPPDGKRLGSNSSGVPVWVETPAPTTGELLVEAKAKQANLISSAKNTISIWQTELQLGIISDDNKASLIAWISYINILQSLDFSSITEKASYEAFVWPTTPVE
ncbi:tail fiber assembly protein [Kosakonia sp. MUSA4]|uniref:tail fiber assembly protein n=1 Tax=Kosakonia sp. MUSA4 TaxID=2067958 RepID=UPI001599574F|nr:tail fiber assembly protein [Kosakonia sp. MUSA4]QJT79571.1 phage tail protein [Kosakonia sp. MUSA4]